MPLEEILNKIIDSPYKVKGVQHNHYKTGRVNLEASAKDLCVCVLKICRIEHEKR